MPDSAVDLFRRRHAAAQTTILIFYRGERSFFCRQWIRRWLTIPALSRRLELADVALLFTSSQSQGKAYSLADQMAPSHSLLDHRIFFFGDPEHALVHHLHSLGLSPPVITNPDSHRAHAWVFDYGMVQPAVLAIASHPAPIYHWAAKPSLLNGAGKLDRPDPWDVWDRIERRLDRLRIARARSLPRAQPSAHPPIPDPMRHPMSKSLPSTSRLPSSPVVPHAVSEVSVADADTSTMSHPTSPRVLGHRSLNPAFDSNPPRSFSHTNPHFLHSERTIVNGPLSTAVDTLDSTLRTHVVEEPDISRTKVVSDVPVHELSQHINAIASDLLADRSLSLSLTASHARHSVQSLPASVTTSPWIEDTEHSAFIDEHDVHSSSNINRTPIFDTRTRLADLVELSELDDEGDEEEVIHRLAAKDSQLMIDIEERQDESGSDLPISVSLEPSFPNDVQSESLNAGKHDPLEPLSSTLENLEVSMASCGSDQVDSANVISKHTSLRTVDSAQVNSVHYDTNSFSSDRRIPEEADEKETGLSDYLRDLKDPTLLMDKAYRSRHDPLPEEKPGNSTVADGSSAMDVPAKGLIETHREMYNNRLSATRASGRARNRLVVEKAEPILSTAPNSNALYAPKNCGAILGDLTEPTDSSYAEARRLHRSAVDLSPFADADNDIEVPEESLTKSSLRDEYEAYDEYIVCEYEVEEHIDEYDSDGLSRSREVMAVAVTDGNQASSSTQDHPTGTGDHPAFLCNDNAGAEDALQYEVDGKFRNVNGRLGTGLYPTGPALTPALEASVLQFPDDHSATHSVGHVRRVLRRIRVPILSSARKSGTSKVASAVKASGGSREGAHSIRPASPVGGESADGDHQRLKRKDTLRNVLRKRPGSTRIGKGCPDQFREDLEPRLDLDEQSSRVGRKETLKSVLKKIPVPKSKRRAATGNGEHYENGPLSEDETIAQGAERHLQTSGPNSPSKQGTFQAVLQRLPSISIPARDHRLDGEKVVGPPTTVNSEPVRIVEMTSNREKSRRYWEMSSSKRSSRRRESARLRGQSTGNETDKKNAVQTVGGESESEGEAAVALLSARTEDRRTEDLRELLQSRYRDGTKVGRTLSRLTHGEDSLGADGSELGENRLESDLVTRSDTGYANTGRAVRSGLSRSVGRGDDGSERRRHTRRKRREEREDVDDETSERLGPKMSFASVSERILSRFKMS